MGRRLGVLCIALGAVCFLVAAALLLFNAQENRRAEQAVQEILPQLEEAIAVCQQPAEGENPTEPETPTEPPTVEIDSYVYLGYLSIPALDLTLPVQSTWSYPQLQISPCRYTGSVQEGNLVIAAHNYAYHFGQISTLQAGDQVTFTDAAGRVYAYLVDYVETLPPTAVEEMTSGGWDLTLFTCTYGGKSRIAVRCTAAEE